MIFDLSLTSSITDGKIINSVASDLPNIQSEGKLHFYTNYCRGITQLILKFE